MANRIVQIGGSNSLFSAKDDLANGSPSTGIPVILKVADEELLAALSGGITVVTSAIDRSVVVPGNSSTAALGIGGVFTGTWVETTKYTNVSIACTSNVASATNGLVLQWSMDGATVDDTDSFSILANAKKQFSFGITHKYIRVIYTNGVVGQTTFRLQTMLHTEAPKPSSHRIQDNIVDEDDAELQMSVLKLRTAANTYVSGASTNSGNFKVSIEEIEGSVNFPVSGLVGIVEGANQAAVIPGANTGVKGLRVYGGPTDPISDIPVYIDYPHHQVHEGESHEYSYLISSLASGSSQDFRFNVPAGLDPTTETPHLIFEVISTLEAEVYFYEDMTYNVGNGGTLQTSYNRNRNSLNAPASKIYLSPTPATTGNNMWIGLVGSGVRTGSGDRSVTEWDLKPNADYLLRITSRANSNKIIVRFLWYEDLGV